MKTKMKKFFAMLLALCIIMGQISMNAFAAGTDGEGGTITETEKVMVNGDKTATDLDENFNSDVTLKIPGKVEQLGVDIVYIVGSFATDDDGNPNVEGDVLISSLVDTMTEIVEAGTPVNFGMVPFSSDNVVAMELTAITSENLAQLPDMITEALATCESLYDGVNMENALIKSKKMLSESALASRPDRQHLVLVSSGFTYFFNSDDKETGEKNKYVSLVPVRISNGGNNLYYMNKGWMQARTGQNNTYPLPKAFSKYNDYRDWELYWSYIDQWARTDIAAGDEVVYEAIDVEVGDFLTWYSSGAGSSSGNGKYIKGVSAEDAVKYPYATRLDNYKVKNPLDEPSAQHAILYERAMWEAYEYVKENIVNAGINFYPIYNELQHAYTNGVSCNNELNDNGKRYDYKIDWTTQYIGHSFMNMLAGGEAVLYNSKSDKTFFDPIKAEILYCVSAGSTVTDYIGYDADEKEGYNFDFVLGAENLKLTVGDKVYSVAEVESAEGVTATYEFTAPDGETATFKLEYYYGTGTDDEYFIWTLNENISKYRQVALTYKVNLKEKSAVVGKHTANTNIDAYLEPVDSEGNKGEKEYFPEPTVEYKNVYTVTVNYYDQESGEVISESFTTEGNENGTYDVTEQDAIEIGGYTYVFTDGDDLTGVLDEDKVINVYYNVEPTTEEPTTEEPTTEEPTTEEPTTEEPTTEEPTTEEEETEDFTEDEVPLGPNPDPETGDTSFVWVLALAVSGLTLAALPILKKSGKDE